MQSLLCLNTSDIILHKDNESEFNLSPSFKGKYILYGLYINLKLYNDVHMDVSIRIKGPGWIQFRVNREKDNIWISHTFDSFDGCKNFKLKQTIVLHNGVYDKPCVKLEYGNNPSWVYEELLKFIVDHPFALPKWWKDERNSILDFKSGTHKVLCIYISSDKYDMYINNI